jgi:hypothetical protein
MNRLILSGILVGICSSSAFAIETSQQRHAQLDLDRNGYLSLNETNGKHRIFYYFGKADKNSDGHIDANEFIAFEKEVPDWERKSK